MLLCHLQSDSFQFVHQELLVNNDGIMGPSFLTAALTIALSAAAANPDCQVIQRPTPELMIAYFKKHLQRHMTRTGLAGTEVLSLLAACCVLEKQRHGCTKNADDLVAVAMEELRQEAKRGEKKTEDELAWALSFSIAAQHVREQNEQHA